MQTNALAPAISSSDSPPGVWPTRWKWTVAAWFFVAAVGLASAATLMHRGLTDVIAGGHRVGEAHQTLAALHAVTARVREVEAAKRAYVLTGDSKYLTAYHAAAARVPHHLETFRGLTGEAALGSHANRLSSAVAERLSAAESLIETYHENGLTAAQEELRAATSDPEADGVAAVAKVIEADQSRKLDDHHRAKDAAARAALTVGIACFTGCFAGFAFALMVIGRESSMRRRTEASLECTNARLERSLVELRDLTVEVMEIATLNNYLQSCRTPQEGYDVLARAVPHLLPGLAGVIGVTHSSRSLVEAVAAWGGDGRPFAPAFAPEQCWGLRQGRPHYAGGGWDPSCGHVGEGPGSKLCLPMVVHGETLGVMSLSSDRPGGLTEREHRTAKLVAEQVSLAIANLRLHEALCESARRDSLTGLFNRRYLTESLPREVARARRHGRCVSVVMVDVDHFKRVNDTFGHEGGNAVLTAVGRTLSSLTRGEDVACRYGGEEFCLILPDTELATALRRAEELRQAVERLNVAHEGRSIGRITLSAGVAAFPAWAEEAVLAAADAALYRAKRGGRNRVEAGEPCAGGELPPAELELSATT